MPDNILQKLEKENQNLWRINRKLSREYCKLMANVKQLQEEATILRNITSQHKKAEELSFSKIDSLLENIKTLMKDSENEQKNGSDNSFIKD